MSINKVTIKRMVDCILANRSELNIFFVRFTSNSFTDSAWSTGAKYTATRLFTLLGTVFVRVWMCLHFDPNFKSVQSNGMRNAEQLTSNTNSYPLRAFAYTYSECLPFDLHPCSKVKPEKKDVAMKFVKISPDFVEQRYLCLFLATSLSVLFLSSSFKFILHYIQSQLFRFSLHIFPLNQHEHVKHCGIKVRYEITMSNIAQTLLFSSFFSSPFVSL